MTPDFSDPARLDAVLSQLFDLATARFEGTAPFVRARKDAGDLLAAVRSLRETATAKATAEADASSICQLPSKLRAQSAQTDSDLAKAKSEREKTLEGLKAALCESPNAVDKARRDVAAAETAVAALERECGLLAELIVDADRKAAAERTRITDAAIAALTAEQERLRDDAKSKLAAVLQLPDFLEALAAWGISDVTARWDKPSSTMGVTVGSLIASRS